jgi:hypothetical protein
MVQIHKKILSEYFQKVLSGEKRTELRLADFEVNKGDILVLVEIDDYTKKETGRKIEVNVSYVMKTKDCTYWSEDDIDKYGFQIIQFDKVE